MLLLLQQNCYWIIWQEFSPEDFYNQLEEESKELEKIPDKTDITQYVKVKLGLVQAEEPTPVSTEVILLNNILGFILKTPKVHPGLNL